MDVHAIPGILIEMWRHVIIVVLFTTLTEMTFALALSDSGLESWGERRGATLMYYSSKTGALN